MQCTFLIIFLNKRKDTRCNCLHKKVLLSRMSSEDVVLWVPWGRISPLTSEAVWRCPTDATKRQLESICTTWICWYPLTHIFQMSGQLQTLRPAVSLSQVNRAIALPCYSVRGRRKRERARTALSRQSAAVAMFQAACASATERI